MKAIQPEKSGSKESEKACGGVLTVQANMSLKNLLLNEHLGAWTSSHETAKTALSVHGPGNRVPAS